MGAWDEEKGVIGLKGTFWGGKNFLCLDCGGGYMGF